MLDFGYFGLFVASFLAATIMPFSSEVALSTMIILGADVWLTILFATLGNWLGSLTTYALGYVGNLDRIEKWFKVSREKTNRFRKFAERFGAWLGLIVWLPIVGDVIAICMGIIRTPIIFSSITILIGKFLRYVALAYLIVKGVDFF